MNRASWDPAARAPADWLARPAVTFVMLYLVAVAVAWWFMATHHLKPYPDWLEADEREYYDISSAILTGKIELTARRTLGFPLALAAIRHVRDSLVFLQGTIVASYALSSPLLALVVRRIGGSALAGIVAGLALALWPPAVYYGTSLYSETLALPVFLAALALLPPGSRQRAVRSGRPLFAAIACGAVLGLATHIRPMYLLFTPCVALIVLAEEAPLRRVVGRVALVAAGYCAVVLPWSVMMTAHFHHPILVTSNGGETLSGGLNPVLLRPEGAGTLATKPRTTWYGPGKWLPLGQNGYLSEADQHLPYDRQDALLRARTSAWIAGHPRDAARLEVAKIGYMWGFVGADRNGRDQLLFGNLPTIALLIGSIALLAVGRGQRLRLIRLWIVPLFVTAVALISWGSWRFRQPADAALLGFCAICMTEWWAARRTLLRETRSS